MKRTFYHLTRQDKPIAILMLLCMILFLGVGGVQADWTAPVMSDYVKVPVFASYSTKPNILIMLDNSFSMNRLAYTDGFAGEPYNRLPRSFPVRLERDDMEENTSGVMRDGAGSANDLDFGTDYVGVRFQKVTIPRGAKVTSAWIEFTAKNSWSLETKLEIRGEAADDAKFLDVTAPKNISSRETTAAQVSWAPGAWSDGQKYSTPDLTGIIREIIDRDGWKSGNAIFFRIAAPGFPSSISAHREAHSRESGQEVAPVLYVNIEQAVGERYYGYFNPDYFYEHRSNVYHPKYKKISCDLSQKTWNVEDLNGSNITLTEGEIAPSDGSRGLWDGNWMNWLAMRRVDVLRKVLMGGKATSRTGGGNQQNIGEDGAKYSKAVDFDEAIDFTKYFSSINGPATSPYKGAFTYEITEGGRVKVNSTVYPIVIQKKFDIEPQDFFEGNLAGVLQRIGPRARWGNMWFNDGLTKPGGIVKNTIDNDFSTNFLPSLQDQACDAWTPLAETLWVASQYFAQETISQPGYPAQAQLFPVAKDTNSDPYWDKAAKRSVPCAKSFVLLLTDGVSTKDSNIPNHLKDFDNDGKDSSKCDEATDSDCDYPAGGTDFLDDVALYARTTDLRADLTDVQNIYLYTILAFEDDANARGLLMDAARNGGFDDLNQNGKPDGTYDDPPDKRYEWDQNGDGIPDTYYEARDGFKLEKELMAAIQSILKRASSGTAASVVSNSRSGEGAIYQSIFYPATSGAGATTVKWVGQVHSLLADAYGNIREDTNGNKRLDVEEDLFLLYSDDMVQKYRDSNANGIFDEEDELYVDQNGKNEFKFGEIQYLWSSNDWLNTVADPVKQRSYASTAKERYIFTFVDGDGDMAAGSGEVKPFTATADPSWGEVVDPNHYFAYIHAYEPFMPPIPTSDPDYRDMVSRQVRRVVNYTRGEDQGPAEVGATVLPAFRSRMIDTRGDGMMETWRLGDVVYSTPTVVGPPAEDFDLIYRDEGYAAFYMRHQHRRNVAYVGANDGMIHAFNTGFFDAVNKGFVTQPVDNLGNPVPGTYHKFDIGAELWAYVPFNLLSHLHWLADPEYEHIYFNDLQPRIFDARIYEGKRADDPTNPNGWATVMVCGMRFGGGKIAADIDKDGIYTPGVDKAMSSAYVILDITDPEVEPKLLGEITFPDLGFTTCHPGVVPMRDFGGDFKEKTNQWYLIFGSGPVSKDGSSVNGANTKALIEGTSTQNAVMYALDLVALANDRKVVTLTGDGAKTYTASAAAQPHYLVRFPEENSSVSKPIAVDWDLDFNTDAVYFGVSSGDNLSGWHGKMRRLLMDNGKDPKYPENWTMDSVLLNLTKKIGDTAGPALDNGQPIMASATAGTDKAGNRWVFFGTGRFYSQSDKLNTDQQSYYGVKEPFKVVDYNKQFTYTTVPFGNLLDVTTFKVYEHGTALVNYGGSFQDLVNNIEDQYQGWRLEFDYQPKGERNLGEAVLAGDVLTFTTYIPSADPCGITGESQVYALYYRTGTAYTRSIIGLHPTDKQGDDALVIKRISLGTGMTITPNIHVGREEGTRAYIQTSTGAIKPLEQENPGVVKSGKMPFIPGEQECP